MAIKRRSVDDTPARGGGGGDRKPSVRDLLPPVPWPKKAQFLRVRLYEGAVPHGYHDYKLFRKGGEPVMNEKYGKQSTVPKTCLSFDPATGEKDPDKPCPYCDADVYFKMDYYVEGVVEDLVDKLPAKNKPSKAEQKTGFKDKDNDGSVTPALPFRMTNKVFERLKGLKQLNKVTIDGDKIPMSVDNEEHGCWINMNYDETGTGDGMYGLQKDDRQAMSEIDEDYLRWDIEQAILDTTESLDEAQRNVDWLKKNMKANEGGGDEEDGDGYAEGDLVEFVTDDDETVRGEISAISDTKVTITDEDGDDHTFRWKQIEKHKKVKAPAKTGASKGKGKAEPEPDDGDDYEPEEGDYVKVLDADDDEVVVGEVEAVDSKTVTIDGESYRRARHTFVKTKAPAKGGKGGKKEPEPEPEPDDDEYEPEDGDYVIVLDGDDEEVGKGVVEESDAKSVTVDGEVYRKAKHTFKKGKAPAKGKAKAEPEPEPEPDDEDYTPEEGDFIKVLDADDDELATGKVTEIDKKTVTIEDADGEEQIFKLAKVTLKPGKKPAKAPAKKPAKSDDDDNEEDDGAKAPPRKAGGRKFNFDD